jgi:hypothetical protein
MRALKWNMSPTLNNLLIRVFYDWKYKYIFLSVLHNMTQNYIILCQFPLHILGSTEAFRLCHISMYPHSYPNMSYCTAFCIHTAPILTCYWNLITDSLILVYSLHEVDRGARGLTWELWEAKNKTQAPRKVSSARCNFTSVITETKRVIPLTFQRNSSTIILCDISPCIP